MRARCALASISLFSQARPTRSGTRQARLTNGANRPPAADLVASALQQILSTSATGSTDGPLFGGSSDVLGALQPLLAESARSESGSSLLGDYAVGSMSNIIEQLMANDPNSRPPTPASKTAIKRLCTTIHIGQSHVDDGYSVISRRQLNTRRAGGNAQSTRSPLASEKWPLACPADTFSSNPPSYVGLTITTRAPYAALTCPPKMMRQRPRRRRRQQPPNTKRPQHHDRLTCRLWIAVSMISNTDNRPTFLFTPLWSASTLANIAHCLSTFDAAARLACTLPGSSPRPLE